MFRNLPPLQTLRAFEASGRLLSMSGAAAELHLTHGAISRHVKTLEADLGVRLFRRLTRRIELTDEGARLLVTVTRVLGDLAQEAERLRGGGPDRRLTISTGISFAAKWLEPRLHRLKALHPEFDIHLDVTDSLVELGGGKAHAAIRYGGGRYRGVTAERVMEETVTPVCSPDYLRRMGGAAAPRDIARFTLLHEDRMLPDWQQWLAFSGLGGISAPRGPAYSHASMIIEAVMRGEGAALGRSVLTKQDIAAGRLVMLFPQLQMKAAAGYDLVYAPGDRDTPKLQALRAWLVREVSAFESEPMAEPPALPFPPERRIMPCVTGVPP